MFYFDCSGLIIIDTQMMINEENTNSIIDRHFYQCYKKIAEKTAKCSWYYAVRALVLGILIPVNHFILEEAKNQKFSLFSIFLITVLSANILQLILSCYMYFTRIRDKAKIMAIAAQLHHTIQIEALKSNQREDYEDLLDLYQNEDSLNFKVSITYYDFENMEKINDVSVQFKEIRQKTGEGMIRNALEADMKFYRLLQNLLKLGSAGIIIFGFVVGSIEQINQAQHSLLQIILISQVIMKPKVFTILILITMIPLIIFFLMIYLCCCRKGQKKAKLPNKIKVTTETISKCTECSICFQDYVLEEDIIVLPCAQSHIFHSTCIEGWAKIKPNCPICRRILCQ